MRYFLSLFLLCLCQLPVFGLTSKGWLIGNVTDTAGVPLASVKVELRERMNDQPAFTTYTGPDGTFRFDSIPYGSYWRTASLDGYDEMTGLISVPQNTALDYKPIVLNRTLTWTQRVRRELKGYDQWIYNINIHQGWRTMGEISFGRGDYYGNSTRRLNGGFLEINSLDKIQVGSEFNFSANKPLIGPKISFDQTWTIFTWGLSLIYYTDFDKGTLYFKPRLGFSWDTYCNFVMGYTIPVMRNHMKSRVNHFMITIEVPILARDSKKSWH